MDLSKHFSFDEFKCKCGCDICEVDETFLYILDLIREEMEIPLNISSGCRCPSHNMRVGGAKNSYHITDENRPCKAVDIKTPSHQMKGRLVKVVHGTISPGGVVITGIGVGANIIHLDIGHDVDTLWTYDSNGKVV